MVRSFFLGAGEAAIHRLGNEVSDSSQFTEAVQWIGRSQLCCPGTTYVSVPVQALFTL